jgi:hypothetical protein
MQSEDVDVSEWWLVYLYDYTEDGRFLWTTVGLVQERETWREWWLEVLNGDIELPEQFDGWWCSDRPVSVGLPRSFGGEDA